MLSIRAFLKEHAFFAQVASILTADLVQYLAAHMQLTWR
jgi:hypothetical protein